VPPTLKGSRLITLDLGLLQPRRGESEFENRSERHQESRQRDADHHFHDEAHTLIGAERRPAGPIAGNLLKPALARGELRTGGATTWSEYKKYF